MKPFEALDIYDLDDSLTSDERQIRDSMRGFVSDEIMPIIGGCFERGEFPQHLAAKLGALGALGSTIHGYGCAGVGAVAYGVIMREIERGDSGIRSFASVQGALCMHPIDAFGSEDLKRKYLPKMAKGELIGCFGLTEPDFGSNPAGMTTTARKDGSGYVLNGSKAWITNGGIADLAIVWAKVPEAGNKVHGFVVERGLNGFTTRDITNKFSLRASVTSDLHFEDVRVEASQMLGVVGLKGPFSCLNNARFGIAWGAVGSAMACFDEALGYAKSRIQFDKPIASFQLVQAKLVRMATEITKAQLIALRLGRLKEADKVTGPQISLAKMSNVSSALEIARSARDLLGAAGITFEYQCGRHMLNLESVNTYEGTEDIHRLVLGEALTGIPAYR